MEKLKRKMDELDRNSFFRRFDCVKDEKSMNDCPYPDNLSRILGDYSACEFCDEEIGQYCSFFQKEVLPFLISLEDFSGGTSFQ